jgi:hypothetical protein
MNGLTLYNLLPTTVYGQASGNYDGSSQDWYSDPGKAANYYRGNGSIQTITFGVNNFVGLVTLQATLETNPNDAEWFDLYDFGDPSTVYPLTDRHPTTVTGNFTWLRVFVQNFDSGNITVTVNY